MQCRFLSLVAKLIWFQNYCKANQSVEYVSYQAIFAIIEYFNLDPCFFCLNTDNILSKHDAQLCTIHVISHEVEF